MENNDINLKSLNLKDKIALIKEYEDEMRTIELELRDLDRKYINDKYTIEIMSSSLSARKIIIKAKIIRIEQSINFDYKNMSEEEINLHSEYDDIILT